MIAAVLVGLAAVAVLLVLVLRAARADYRDLDR